MIEVDKFGISGEKTGSVSLNDAIFNVSTANRDALIYEVVKMYLANQRQGNASTKGRSEVRGSTTKLYRQKGTGNARAGSRRSPIRVGGGVAFGPRPKDWYRPIPKKKKRLALKIALTEKAKSGKITIIEDLNFEKPDTRKALEMLSKISPDKGKKLLVIEGSDPNIIKSFANIPGIETDRADSLFPYEILKAGNLLITESALKIVEEVFEK